MTKPAKLRRLTGRREALGSGEGRKRCCGRSDFAKHGDDFAHDLRVRAIDGRIGGVVRDEPHMPLFFAECFHGGFVVKQGCDNVPVFRGLLFTHYDEIAVADGGVDHGIPVDFKHEQIAGSGEPLRQAHDIFDMLLCGDRGAGGDAPDQWHVA